VLKQGQENSHYIFDFYRKIPGKKISTIKRVLREAARSIFSGKSYIIGPVSPPQFPICFANHEDTLYLFISGRKEPAASFKTYHRKTIERKITTYYVTEKYGTDFIANEIPAMPPSCESKCRYKPDENYFISFIVDSQKKIHDKFTPVSLLKKFIIRPICLEILISHYEKQRCCTVYGDISSISSGVNNHSWTHHGAISNPNESFSQTPLANGRREIASDRECSANIPKVDRGNFDAFFENLFFHCLYSTSLSPDLKLNGKALPGVEFPRSYFKDSDFHSSSIIGNDFIILARDGFRHLERPKQFEFKKKEHQWDYDFRTLECVVQIFRNLIFTRVPFMEINRYPTLALQEKLSFVGGIIDRISKTTLAKATSPSTFEQKTDRPEKANKILKTIRLSAYFLKRKINLADRILRFKQLAPDILSGPRLDWKNLPIEPNRCGQAALFVERKPRDGDIENNIIGLHLPSRRKACVDFHSHVGTENNNSPNDGRLSFGADAFEMKPVVALLKMPHKWQARGYIPPTRLSASKCDAAATAWKGFQQSRNKPLQRISMKRKTPMDHPSWDIICPSFPFIMFVSSGVWDQIIVTVQKRVSSPKRDNFIQKPGFTLNRRMSLLKEYYFSFETTAGDLKERSWQRTRHIEVPKRIFDHRIKIRKRIKTNDCWLQFNLCSIPSCGTAKSIELFAEEFDSTRMTTAVKLNFSRPSIIPDFTRFSRKIVSREFVAPPNWMTMFSQKTFKHLLPPFPFGFSKFLFKSSKLHFSNISPYFNLKSPIFAVSAHIGGFYLKRLTPKYSATNLRFPRLWLFSSVFIQHPATSDTQWNKTCNRIEALSMLSMLSTATGNFSRFELAFVLPCETLKIPYKKVFCLAHKHDNINTAEHSSTFSSLIIEHNQSANHAAKFISHPADFPHISPRDGVDTRNMPGWRAFSGVSLRDGVDTRNAPGWRAFSGVSLRDGVDTRNMPGCRAFSGIYAFSPLNAGLSIENTEYPSFNNYIDNSMVDQMHGDFIDRKQAGFLYFFEHPRCNIGFPELHITPLVFPPSFMARFRSLLFPYKPWNESAWYELASYLDWNDEISSMIPSFGEELLFSTIPLALLGSQKTELIRTMPIVKSRNIFFSENFESVFKRLSTNVKDEKNPVRLKNPRRNTMKIPRNHGQGKESFPKFAGFRESLRAKEKKPFFGFTDKSDLEISLINPVSQLNDVNDVNDVNDMNDVIPHEIRLEEVHLTIKYSPAKKTRCFSYRVGSQKFTSPISFQNIFQWNQLLNAVTYPIPTIEFITMDISAYMRDVFQFKGNCLTPSQIRILKVPIETDLSFFYISTLGRTMIFFLEKEVDFSNSREMNFDLLNAGPMNDILGHDPRRFPFFEFREKAFQKGLCASYLNISVKLPQSVLSFRPAFYPEWLELITPAMTVSEKKRLSNLCG